MKIGYNPSSMEAYNALLKNGRATNASSAKLSTGIKINKASQNPAGLAISNKTRAQAEGIDKAGQNSSNAMSLLQTAEGALSEMHAIIQRMRELTVQASNDTNSPSDRELLQKEIDQLISEIDSMSNRCEFNQMKLLRGGGVENTGEPIPLTLTFHTGANKNYNMQVTLPLVTVATLGVADTNGDILPNYSVNDINVTTNDQADRVRAIEIADAAVEQLASLRAEIGAYVNRLEHTVTYLSTTHVASNTSLSRLYDTDMAAEMSNYSRLQVLTQVATSIMSQANQSPQNVLQLLQ